MELLEQSEQEPKEEVEKEEEDIFEYDYNKRLWFLHEKGYPGWISFFM